MIEGYFIQNILILSVFNKKNYKDISYMCLRCRIKVIFIFVLLRRIILLLVILHKFKL